MTRQISEIDTSHEVSIWPLRHSLDGPSLELVDGLEGITLTPAEAKMFLGWIEGTSWKSKLEEDLQSGSQDSEGNPLLSTWMPLVTFREDLCAGGRHLQDDILISLMDRLRPSTRGWRELGVDTVVISGRIRRIDSTNAASREFVNHFQNKEGVLLKSFGGGMFFREYAGENGEYVDYEILHSDLSITINDDDAAIYKINGSLAIDHSPETLGI